MKKVLLSAIFMVMGIISMNAGVASCFFNISEKGASAPTLSISFAQSPVLTYAFEESPCLVVSAEGVDSQSFVLDKQYSIFYTETAPTGVSETILNSAVKMQGTAALLSNLKANETVNVYAANGAQVASVVADANGVAVVDLSAMPKGVVIIKAGASSFKLKK